MLGAINPRYGTRPKSKYYEREGEFAEQPSAPLRCGLTEAMIALAVFPDRASLIPNVGRWVDGAIRTLLHGAGPELWWSLSYDSTVPPSHPPDAFLDALEEGWVGDDPPVMSLFRTDEGIADRTEYLANLLWSLEMLARSPDHLMRAALLLVRLDELDAGGKGGNRPFASLRRIFVAWSHRRMRRPASASR